MWWLTATKYMYVLSFVCFLSFLLIQAIQTFFFSAIQTYWWSIIVQFLVPPCDKYQAPARPQRVRPVPTTQSKVAVASRSSCKLLPPFVCLLSFLFTRFHQTFSFFFVQDCYQGLPVQKFSVLDFSLECMRSTPHRRTPWCTSWESHCHSPNLRRRCPPKWFGRPPD